ncbi:MAG: CCA tRNA nucleotidyltransferase [Cyanobacteria bacterium P01_D01_bin.105]
MPLFEPKTWPFSLALLPTDAYLVGGSVRDRLLNRHPTYLDLDFVLPADTLKTAAHIANQHKAGFVVLDADRQIARVTFAQMTVDFAQRQGRSTQEDLNKRDFTVNAIAYSPHTHTLIDPLGGQADLAARILRMVKRENLAADPIRLMRGYRQAAQLGFTLEANTQATITELAPNLKQVAVERIRHELDALLSTPAGTQQLPDVYKSQLLNAYLPHFNRHSIEQLRAIDGAFEQLAQSMPSYANQLKGWLKPVPVGFYRSWVKAAKLSQMLADDLKTARQELEALKYSRSEAQVVLTLLSAQSDLETMKSKAFGRSHQFFLFKNTGQSFLAFSLLALAKGVEFSIIKSLIDRFQDATDEVAHAKTLLSGNTLINQLGIKPGPDLGALLSAVEQAQAEGKVRSEQEAITFVKTLYF